MAKFKIKGMVMEVLRQEPINGGAYFCSPFVITSSDEHPSDWFFKSYGEVGNTANRLRIGDEVEVEFTSRDKKSASGMWHSNKVALLIKIINDASSKPAKVDSGDEQNWNS